MNHRAFYKSEEALTMLWGPNWECVFLGKDAILVLDKRTKIYQLFVTGDNAGYLRLGRMGEGLKANLIVQIESRPIPITDAMRLIAKIEQICKG